jgi:phosphoribosylamine---glycine ligase
VEVLVIGSGGREHAIALSLAASTHVSKVHVAPGNGGTDNAANGRVCNVAIDVSATAELVQFAVRRGVALAVVGPEVPLVAGISDALTAAGVPCFGPSAAAAQLEASKAFSKDFMARHGIRTARYSVQRLSIICTGSVCEASSACKRTVMLSALCR